MTKAASFSAYVTLLTAAESALRSRYANVEDRLAVLRGIYYGTTWSLDYLVESKRSVLGAQIRNAGFVTYTGGHYPGDPHGLLSPAMIKDLQDSQSLKDRGRSLDVGHLLIGLETRTTAAMRTVDFPGQGGTGIEIVTWLGDLGGGAANLARRRATAPRTTVDWVFHNATSDYGVTDNLEGDAAGYLVASGGAPLNAPSLPTTVADAVKAYLIPATSPQWKTRAAVFATALGATISGARITNEAALIGTLSAKLSTFAIWYAATRWVPTRQLVGSAASEACKHMDGAAREVATVFVKTLGRAIASAPSAITAVGPYPAPTPAGVCTSTLLSAASLVPSWAAGSGD